jgi:hypothetical protein
MTISLTEPQKTAIAQEAQDVITAVEINLESPLLYCDGLVPITLDGDIYTPHEIHLGNIRLDTPAHSSAILSVLDLDKTLANLWLASRLTGITATTKEAVFSDGDWLVTRTLSWHINNAGRSPKGVMQLSLRGGTGLRNKAGLAVGGRADWRYAPSPDEAAYVGDTIIQV